MNTRESQVIEIETLRTLAENLYLTIKQARKYTSWIYTAELLGLLPIAIHHSVRKDIKLGRQVRILTGLVEREASPAVACAFCGALALNAEGPQTPVEMGELPTNASWKLWCPSLATGGISQEIYDMHPRFLLCPACVIDAGKKWHEAGWDKLNEKTA